MSVLPDVGSELPANSDRAAVVCTALVDEAVNDALDVVVMLDEHSLMCDFVWSDVVPVNQDFVSADVCGDDRFSPGVRNDVSLHWQMDIDFCEMVNWECQFNGEDMTLARAPDWKSVLRCIALMSRLPKFPDGNGPKCFDDIGNNCIMNISAWGTCPRVRTSICSPETFAQTLPTQQECLVSDVPSGAVAQLRGCERMRGNRVFPGDIVCTRDWGYIRPAAVGESPVHTQPVTGSLLFRSPLRCVLGRWLHALMRGCGDNECSPGEIGWAGNWSYIRPASPSDVYWACHGRTCCIKD